MQLCTVYLCSGNCSTCFGWYVHPSSVAHTTVSTASGICHTVTSTCRYRGRVGTGLNVRQITLIKTLRTEQIQEVRQSFGVEACVFRFAIANINIKTDRTVIWPVVIWV